MTTRNTDRQMTEAELIAFENSEAQIGTEEDSANGSGRTEALDQNNGGDPLEGGVERREPIRHSPQDSDRMAIANRFRRPETEERPFNGDMSDTENLYGEFGREETDEPADPAEGEDLTDIDDQRQATARQPAAQQEGRELTIRGVKRFYTNDEITAAAQKTLAGDSYLEEARSLLDAAKEIRADRTGATRQHPDGEMGAQDDLAPAGDADAQHPELPIDLVQDLQFGDPEQAAKKLVEYIDRRAEAKAGKAVETSGVERAFDQDLSRSQKALKAFQDANPDLANDELAAMAIERTMYSLYREDLTKLGYTEDQLPKTNAELANWHRFARINGYEVRNTSDLLEASKGKFIAWRGGPKPAPQSEQQRQGKPAPRIAVSVDRDTRRQAIPLQPSRASAPRRDAQAPVSGDRSSVVANMRKARGQV